MTQLSPLMTQMTAATTAVNELRQLSYGGLGMKSQTEKDYESINTVLQAQNQVLQAVVNRLDQLA